MGFFNQVMDHSEAKSLVDEKGWDGFLESFQEQYPDHKLYACSQYWYDDSKYISKFRGTGGDIIVGWKGVHDGE